MALAVELLGLAGSMVCAGCPAAGATSSGQWVWPLVPTPQVVGAFDPPDEPWLPGHRGVDLIGHAHQPVRAAGSGQVSFAGQLAGVRVVVVNHGSLRTTYQPVDPTVGVGDNVAAGDVIGRLGMVGGHCLPEVCLHWGLLRGDNYLNPLLLLGGGPVRLLPLSGTGLEPGAMLTGPARSSPAPRVPESALGSDPASVEASGWTSRVSRPEPNTSADSPAALRSPPPAEDPRLWAAGWIVLAAVGAGGSLRFSTRWAPGKRLT